MSATDAAGPVAHRLRFATPDSAVIAWPERFGRRYLVTVDVEEEFDWSRPFDAHARDVTATAALPAMHARLARHGIVPTYMVDYPVASDPAAAAILRGLMAEGAEIGAQLHPWVNPPASREDKLASFAGNLPPGEEAAKLDALMTAIETAAGHPPRTYRAGRYGLGPATATLLAERGFVADLSMRARFDYRGEGGADYTRVGNAAFRWDRGLVELPVSTVFVGAARRAGPRWHPRLARAPALRGVAARLGLFSRVPLTPEGTSAREAVAAVTAAGSDGERLLQLTFHSPSLVPGHTPYVRDASDLARFHRWWDAVLPALARAGYAPVTMQEVIAAAT